MTTFQKVVKGLATAFAIFLIVNICFGILSAIGIVFGISDVYSNAKKIDIVREFDTSSIEDIDISASISKIYILKGDSIKVEATSVNENTIIKEERGKLIINEKDKSNFFKSKRTSEIRIYLPEELYVRNFELNSGVSDTFIEYLRADRVNLDLGVGNVTLSKIFSNNTKINSGIGNLEITDGEIGNADFDLGVGNTNINAILNGNSKIECGVGDVNVNLLRSIDGYETYVDKGLGTVKLNNQKISENIKYGEGLNKIHIEAGLGNIDINVNE